MMPLKGVRSDVVSPNEKSISEEALSQVWRQYLSGGR